MDPILEIVERSNQRGGRMLSVMDLIEAETLSSRQTAWLLERIERGSSWMVGALPGGAGKTTIMSALLAMLPQGQTISLATRGTDWQHSKPGDCVVAYEISPAHYEAYIWGEELRQFVSLGKSGCRLVTNLHADTLEQAYDQIVKDNGVEPEVFPVFEVFLPIEITGGPYSRKRVVNSMYYFEDGKWQEWDAEQESSLREREILGFLETCRKHRLVTVTEVRSAWLGFMGPGRGDRNC